MNKYNANIITIQKTIRGFLTRKKLKVSCPGYWKKFWDLRKGDGMIYEFNKIVDNYFDEQAPSPFMSYDSNVVKDRSNQESLDSGGSNSFEKIENVVFLSLEKPILEPVNFFMFRLREKLIEYPEDLKEVKKKYVIKIDKEPDVREIKIRGKVVVDCLSLEFNSWNEFKVVLNKPLCELYFYENRTELPNFKRGDETRNENFGNESEGRLINIAKFEENEEIQRGNNAGIMDKYRKIEEKHLKILEGVQKTPVKRQNFVKKSEETPDKHQVNLSKHEKTPDKHKNKLNIHEKTPEKYKKPKIPTEIQKIAAAIKKTKNHSPESQGSSIESASNLIERLTNDYQINLDSLSSSIVSSKDKPEKPHFKIRVPEKPVHPINSIQVHKTPEIIQPEPPKYLQNLPKPQSQPKPSSSQQEKKSKFFPYEKNFHILPLIYSQNFGFSNYKDYGFISDLNTHRPGLKKQKIVSQGRIGSCKSESKFIKVGKRLPKFSPYNSRMIEKQYIEHFCLDKDVQTLNRNSGGFVVNEKIRQLFMK